MKLSDPNCTVIQYHKEFGLKAANNDVLSDIIRIAGNSYRPLRQVYRRSHAYGASGIYHDALHIADDGVKEIMLQDASTGSNKRVLDPMDRVSEVLFGLIMVLTFTGALSAAQSGQAEVRAMLIGSIGCNLAWGLIDAIMYLMACLSERATALLTVMAVRRAATAEKGREVIADALPRVVASALHAADLEKVRVALNQMPDLPKRPRLQREDWLGAVGVFFLVFLASLPVVLPFIFLQDPVVALRLSNAVAVTMLFGTGYAYGHLAGHHPLAMALVMVVLGIVLVAIAIALGG